MLSWLNQLTILATSAILLFCLVKGHADESQRIAICGPNSLHLEFTKKPKTIQGDEIHIETGDFRYDQKTPSVRARGAYVFRFKGFQFRALLYQAEAIQLFRVHCSGAGRGNHKVVILGRGELK